MRNRPLDVSGFQIAFLVFAVVFLGAPAQKYLGPVIASYVDFPMTFGRLLFFVPAVLILLLIPQVRRFCSELLLTPIRVDRRVEVAVVTAVNLLKPFAVVGAIVLWYWMPGGEMALARRVGMEDSVRLSFERALSADGIALILLATLVAPVVEELVFRGMLFRTWEAQWGWFKSMIATSVVFAAYHPVPAAAFVGSVLLVLVYRRTGSIWAPIIVHAVHNGLLWYPLMGQFVFRAAGKETGEIHLWPFHLLALALVTIALPVYAWMARDRDIECAEQPEEVAVARS